MIVVTIGIVVGSTRPGRVGEQVARWAQHRAAGLPGVQVDLVDLVDVALPFLDEAEHASTGIYAHAHTQQWSRRIQALDALVLVTPEYNNSFSAPLKNALDFLVDEWRRKPVAMIGYGMTSAGTRAVAALTPVVTALGMVPAGAVYLPLRSRVDICGVLQPTGDDSAALNGLLVDLLELAALLRPAHRADAMVP